MEAWLIAVVGLTVLFLAATIAGPFFTYRDPKRRADAQLDLFAYRGWYITGAIAWALVGAIGLLVGTAFVATSADAIWVMSGWALIVAALTPAAPIWWWVHLALSDRAARRSIEEDAEQLKEGAAGRAVDHGLSHMTWLRCARG